MNFHLFYTEEGRPTLASFNTADQRHMFIGAFTLLHLDNPTDNQVDLVFDGTVTHVGQGIITV